MTEDTMVEFYEPGIVEVVPQCRERTGPQSRGRENSKGDEAYGRVLVEPGTQ